jgi:hypothetical protein
MNSTAEKNARQKCAELFDPDRVTVRVKTSCRLGFCLPDKDGDEEHTAVFSTMTFGDNYAICIFLLWNQCANSNLFHTSS